MVYVLFICDCHHSRESKVMISINTTLSMAVKNANDYSKSENEIELTPEEKEQLTSMLQTQGYDSIAHGKMNIDEFMIEVWDKNKNINEH